MSTTRDPRETASLVPVPDLDKIDDSFDSLVVVSSALSQEKFPGKDAVESAKEVDNTVGASITFHVLDSAPGKRLIVSPTGPTNRDFDDVRRWGDAARAGILRAKKAGSKRPIISVPAKPDLNRYPEYTQALEVALLGALQELYQPLQARESKGRDTVEPVLSIGVHSGWHSADELKAVCRHVSAIESGKRLARDLGDPDPERMAPKAFADYVTEAFKGVKNVTVKVRADRDDLEKEYPLLSAVARATRNVERHRPQVVRIEYKGEGEIDNTLFFSGKGVTYDTGGADVKTGGVMAGMSRDKCGASNIAGFILTVGLLQPPGLRVVAELGIVRNSIGSEAYVADEIIKGHSEVRVKIINTDAEGRLVLADCLSHLRLEAVDAVNPHLMTMATLTGHAVRSVGPYSVMLDNKSARQENRANKLQSLGRNWGDGIEISNVRREDFNSLRKDNTTFDILQHVNSTSRNHQFAAAFLTVASGLDKHGLYDSEKPLPYTHIDIAGSAVEDCDFLFGKTTGCVITALSATYILPKLNK